MEIKRLKDFEEEEEKETEKDISIKEFLEIKCEHFNPNDYYLGTINCDALGGECQEHYCSFKKLRHFVYHIYNDSVYFNPLKQKIVKYRTALNKIKDVCGQYVDDNNIKKILEIIKDADNE